MLHYIFENNSVMMKRIVLVQFWAVFMAGLSLQAQDVTTRLQEAANAYSSGQLDEARFALQEVISGINQEIGKEILKALPDKLGGLAADTKQDNVSGAVGFAGLSVSRVYGAEDHSARVEILGDSPLLASINAILSLPAIMGSSDPNQKRIRVGGYKGLLQKDTGEVPAYTVQIPIDQTLLTLHVTGVPDENTVMSMVNALPIDKISKYSK